jgi:hypothetical protein
MASPDAARRRSDAAAEDAAAALHDQGGNGVGERQYALKARVVVKGQASLPAAARSWEPQTVVTLTLNPMEATLAPDSLEAIAAYFVPSFEYPFHEHLVIDALNALPEGAGQLAAKLAYLVKRSSSGCPPLPARLCPSRHGPVSLRARARPASASGHKCFATRDACLRAAWVGRDLCDHARGLICRSGDGGRGLAPPPHCAHRRNKQRHGAGSARSR